MKVKNASRLMLVSFVLVLFVNVQSQYPFSEFEISKDFKGYSVPKIEDYNLVNSVEINIVIDNVKENVVLKSYELVNEKIINYRDVILVNSNYVKKELLELENEKDRDRNDSIRFWVKYFTVCFLKSRVKPLYYDLTMITDNLSENRIIKDSLFHRKIRGKIDPDSLGSIASYRSYFASENRGIIFDSDSDGNFESLFFLPNEISTEEDGGGGENLSLREVKKIIAYINRIKTEKIPFKRLIHEWENYRKNPTSKNAEKFLKVIPDEAVDKTGICFHPDFARLKNQFEKRNTSMKFLTIEEKNIWNEIENNLNFIKWQAFLGDANAVRILFKLYRVFYNSYLFQFKLDLIMDELSILKTDLFLEILNENSDLDFSVLLDMYIGFDFLNKTIERYENIKKKICAFKRINKPELKKIKNRCINVLNKLKIIIEKSGLLIVTPRHTEDTNDYAE